MSFLKRTTSFVRFRLNGISEDTKKDFEEKLRQFAFVPIDETAEEKGYGWTSIDNAEDYAFAFSSPRKGKYLCFGFRYDERKIASAVLKRQIGIALDQERKELEKAGRKYISRERKKELAEQVKLRILAKTLPVPAVFDVIWDTETDCIFFAGTGKKICNTFWAYFMYTLGRDEARTVSLELCSPAVLAEKLMPDSAELDKIEPTFFAGGDVSEEMAGKDTVLGEEFLTWLWCKSDRNCPFTHKNRNFYFTFDSRLSVRGYNGSNQVSASVSGAFNPMFEARLGLEKGKKVSSARLAVGNSDETYQTGIKADSFAFFGLQTPSFVADTEDTDSNILIKMDFVQTAMQFFDEAYKQFLLCRLDEEKWQAEQAEIKDWIMYCNK